MKLILLPFAGGTSSSYNFLRNDLDSGIEFITPELAGRAIRCFDKMYQNVEEAVADIFNLVKDDLGDGYILFGHSMGAVLAYELYCKIIEEHLTSPQAIFVSGGVIDKTFLPYDATLLNDNEFFQIVSKLGGIPKSLLNNQELISYVSPFFKNDIKMIAKYSRTCIKKISCALYVLNGTDDSFTTSEITSWENYSVQKPLYYMFSGGHFFIREHHKEIAELINSVYESKGEIMDKILEIINKYADKPVNKNEMDNIYIKELGINSLNYVKIIVEIEMEFDIEFDDDMLIANDTTIRDFISNVENLIT